MECERCGKTTGIMQIHQVVNGREEVHRLCQSCIKEIMKAMGPMGSMLDEAISGNAPFGFTPRNAANGGTGKPNSTNTATAERRAKYSKTPTLDQYGRDLTSEAAEGRLDPASGRERELRRVITILGRRQKNNLRLGFLDARDQPHGGTPAPSGRPPALGYAVDVAPCREGA